MWGEARWVTMWKPGLARLLQEEDGSGGDSLLVKGMAPWSLLALLLATWGTAAN